MMGCRLTSGSPVFLSLGIALDMNLQEFSSPLYFPLAKAIVVKKEKQDLLYKALQDLALPNENKTRGNGFARGSTWCCLVQWLQVVRCKEARLQKVAKHIEPTKFLS